MTTIAIVGATGLVGQRLCEIIDYKLPDVQVRLFANASAGAKINFHCRPITVESCERLSDCECDYAMFMATNDISLKYIPILLRRGVTCIDNSSAYRLKKDVPLVVPCVNGDEIGDSKLIANPNCSTIQTVVALNALKALQITKFTAVTYQAAAGAGKEGLADLQEQRSYGNLRCFAHPITDNVIPCIGELHKGGYTEEERKMMAESRKILRLPRLKVNAFCARVPVSVGHCVFVNVHCKQRIHLPEIRQMLSGAPNVLLFDDAAHNLYPMPSMLRNTKYVGVGRLCKDPTANALNMFVVADNLLRGASYNAYEILCRLLQREAK